MRPALGALVGAVGGLVFVLVNAGGLPSGWVWPLRLLGLAAFTAVLVAAVRAWPGQPGGPPSRESLRPYLVAVGAMAVAIPLGSVALRRAMRSYVRRWINEWDLKRLYPGAEVHTEEQELHVDYGEDHVLEVGGDEAQPSGAP